MSEIGLVRTEIPLSPPCFASRMENDIERVVQGREEEEEEEVRKLKRP